VNELAALASFGVRGVEVITNESLYRNEQLEVSATSVGCVTLWA
jgi:hypothetical protein